MTMALAVGASFTDLPSWEDISWSPVKKSVRRLQMRIAKAYREKKYGKVKSLQWLLSHSYHAKLLAVKRVISNRGAKTPGVDGETWATSRQKMKAVARLKRRGYKAQPLRRIHIPKKSPGKWRPLSIPNMRCRAQQALHLLTLDPIAETIADKNSYGFRPLRSTADAIAQCFIALAKRYSPQYILEGDIESCFDNLSHEWLLENVPMDKVLLKQWLQAGYINKGDPAIHSTRSGTPQGGLISPTLLIVALAGLEQAAKRSVTYLRKHKINVIVYADDFIITGATKEVLEEKVKPAVARFLNTRGLALSKEKTRTTLIDEGVDFLGMNLRKYQGKLIIKPVKSSIKAFLADIRKTIKSHRTAKTENLIRLLNPKIRGWTNYYRHVCAKETFGLISKHIFQAVWSWAKRRHPEKGRRWIKRKYFRGCGRRNWVFSTHVKQRDGSITPLDLVDASLVRIRRHIKIRADATPYDPSYNDYFNRRKGHKTRAPKGVSYEENDKLGSDETLL